MQRFIAGLIGLIAGYTVWLACISTLTFAVPAKYLVTAGVIVLMLMLAASAVSAILLSRQGRRSASLGCWIAPVAPTLASIYSLVVLLT